MIKLFKRRRFTFTQLRCLIIYLHGLEGAHDFNNGIKLSLALATKDTKLAMSFHSKLKKQILLNL